MATLSSLVMLIPAAGRPSRAQLEAAEASRIAAAAASGSPVAQRAAANPTATMIPTPDSLRVTSGRGHEEALKRITALGWRRPAPQGEPQATPEGSQGEPQAAPQGEPQATPEGSQGEPQAAPQATPQATPEGSQGEPQAAPQAKGLELLQGFLARGRQVSPWELRRRLKLARARLFCAVLERGGRMEEANRLTELWGVREIPDLPRGDAGRFLTEPPRQEGDPAELRCDDGSPERAALLAELRAIVAALVEDHGLGPVVLTVSDPPPPKGWY